LIIEDAEKILKSRDDLDDINNGISNLLNISDGILNDILHFQIINLLSIAILLTINQATLYLPKLDSLFAFIFYFYD
jgi:hypothetical protein